MTKHLSHSLYARLTQGLFCAGFLIIIGSNIPGLIKAMQTLKTYKKLIPYQKIGQKFAGLAPYLRNVDFVGYYTDADFSQDGPVKDFAQAQYILAPTILEHNNLSHEYILLVCQNEANAWKKMRELNAVPLRRNIFGMILARKPKGS